MRVSTVRDLRAEFEGSVSPREPSITNQKPLDVAEQPQPTLRGSKGRSSASGGNVEGGPVVPADPGDTDPKPTREKRWRTKLIHPAYRILFDACPNCGFPECEGGYCAECGWSESIKTGVYVN